MTRDEITRNLKDMGSLVDLINKRWCNAHSYSASDMRQTADFAETAIALLHAVASKSREDAALHDAVTQEERMNETWYCEHCTGYFTRANPKACGCFPLD